MSEIPQKTDSPETTFLTFEEVCRLIRDQVAEHGIPFALSDKQNRPKSSPSEPIE